jgi:hypothetical protein
VVQEHNVSLQLQPADAAQGADYFELLSWQGGKARQTPLISDGAGGYRSARPVPTGGTWKSAVFLTRRDVLAALPISMPADAEYNIAAVKVEPQRQAAFLPADKVMMAENHAGSATPRMLAITGFFTELAVTTVFFLLAFAGLSRGFGSEQRRLHQPRVSGARQHRPSGPFPVSGPQ